MTSIFLATGSTILDQLTGSLNQGIYVRRMKGPMKLIFSIIFALHSEISVHGAVPMAFGIQEENPLLNTLSLKISVSSRK